MQVILPILTLMAGIAQATAFMQGLETWLGLGAIISVIIFVAAIMLGAFGGLITGIIAFYGAWKGWHWPWYGAVAIAFPYLILLIAMAGLGGVMSMVFDRSRDP
ncbi:MAG: hypothetical protein HXY30_16010 [Pseudorhodoplanes sp.]|nr:hypothetical protein [Pseudorhodoplanes sp.]